MVAVTSIKSAEDVKIVLSIVIAEHVMMLTEVPFLFTSTVRENLDPFGEKTDLEIRRALEKCGVWDHIRIN